MLHFGGFLLEPIDYHTAASSIRIRARTVCSFS